MKFQKAFTLMELLIVIGITIVLAGVGISTYVNQQRAKLLDMAAQEVVGYLRYAQQKSMAQESGNQWGIRFKNPADEDDFYALSLYDDTDNSYISTEETRYLSSGIEYESPTVGNYIDVSFSKLTGTNATSTAQSITIKSTVTNSTSTISISSQGLISY
jgi:type II secretory pathway pseudopilin PulG